MKLKHVTALAALLLAGAAQAQTDAWSFRLTDFDDLSTDRGTLAVVATPTYDEVDLVIDGFPQYTLQRRYDFSVGDPFGMIEVLHDGQTLEGFQFDYYVCDPPSGSCNFSMVWTGEGQAQGGEVDVDDPFRSPLGFNLAPVPEPAGLAMLLAGLLAAGAAVRRRRG